MRFSKRDAAEIGNLTREQIAKARNAIMREDSICFDVAAENGQIFDNVKHMTWFVKAVAEEMRGY